MLILNIAAGKQNPIDFIDLESDIDPNAPECVLNVDNGYFDNSTRMSYIENLINEWTGHRSRGNVKYNLKMDAYRFLESTSLMFDRVVIYRFLEHVPFTDVLRFIYLVSNVVKKGGMVDVIVPNYDTLAEMIVKEDPFTDPNFQASDIILTTELLNEPSQPHASIWTPLRALYFWEMEKRFSICELEINPKMEFDGRDIYMRFFARRV